MLDLSPADFPDDQLRVVVDDDNECHEDNNEALITDGLCLDTR